MSKRTRIISIVVLLACGLYVGSYISLSRRGYAQARQQDMEGFYYFTPTPTPTNRWRLLNGGSRFLFAPLNLIDRTLLGGKHPASDPLWSVN